MSNIQKYQPHEMVSANNAVKLINKLLAISNAQLIPYRKGDKWGFCTPNKNIIIECIYEDVSLFSEDMASVKLNNIWGLINKQGYVVIQFLNDKVSFLKVEDGLLVVSIGSGWWERGVVDKMGNVVVPYVYQSVTILGGLIYVTDSLCYDNTYRYGYYNRSGKLLTSERFNYEYPYSKETELTYNFPDPRYIPNGYVTNQGKVIDTSKYQTHENFSNGMAAVQFNNKWGFINTNGEIVIDFIYDETDSFIGDNTYGLKNGMYRLINRSGQEVFRFNEHIKIKNAESGFFIIEESLISKWGVLKTYGVLDNNGNVVIKASHEYELYFDNGYAQIYGRSRMDKEIININGYSCFRTSKYDFIGRFQHGFFQVANASRYGLIDTSGNEIIPCIYNSIQILINNCIIVEINKKYGLVNCFGKMLFPCIYDSINAFNSNNYMRLEMDKKHGLIDSFGKIIIPFKYDHIDFFDKNILDSNPCIIAKVTNSGKGGYLGMDGTEYWED